MKKNNKVKNLHYGWIVAIGCNLLYFYGVGLTTGTFSIFLPSMVSEMKLTSTEASSIVSVICTIGIICMLMVNRVFTKCGIRNTVFACGLLIAAGNFVFSKADSLAVCYLAGLMVGVGYGCCSMIPVSLLILQWFDRKRGTAVGIAYSGSGLAVIIFSPILTNIIIEYGVREAFLFQSASTAVLALTACLLIRNRPEEKSLTKYGYINDLAYNTDESSPGGPGLSGSVYLTCDYAKLAIVALAVGMTVQPLVTHLPSFLISVGYKPAFAMYVVSIYGFSMMVWKTAYGLIIDRLGSKITNFIVFPLWIATISGSIFVSGRMAYLYIFLLILGIGPAMATVSMPVWVGEIFRNGASGGVLSSILIIENIGASIGVILMGYLFDLTGSYTIPFIIVIILSLTAFISITGLYKNKASAKCKC